MLCVAMMLSVMVMSTGAASFTDEDKVSDNYAEAVEVLTGMGVIKGDENNAFRPQDSITRAEVSTLIYRAATADVNNGHPGLTAGANLFTDVSEDDWFAGYVNYCADAEYVKGYEDNTFRAGNDVTGYEVLAMILRAVGYDKNNEFTGINWTIQVASTATQLGMLKNVDKDTNLAEPASRELVAELIFRAMNVPTVEYTPSLGYLLKDYSLGWQQFRLASRDNEDVWGRPNVEWYKYNTSTIYATIEQAAAYTTNVKVDECDIAEALGIDKAAAIESAYIDGYQYPSVKNTAITSDANGMIDPTQTRSYAGAQGRQLEVYDMGKDGYRIVEINTYLGVVTDVTEATTDKNGHTTDATIDLNVYTGGSGANATKISETYTTDGFAKNDYVLVTMTVNGTSATQQNAKVVSVELAPVVSAGTQTAYHNAQGTTPAYITVGGSDYNNADKFFLNLYNTKTDIDQNKDTGWNVLTDNDGNAIGMVQSTMSYLVIEAARFDRTPGTVNEGQVLADLVLADGTRVDNAVIATVGGKPVRHISNIPGDIDAATFSDATENNGDYYNHLLTYSVNAEGEYAIGNTDAGANASSVTLNNEGTYFMGNGARVAVNDNTVFLVKGSDGTYTAYQGKDNVPDLINATVCYLVPTSSSYASVVVVTSSEAATNTFDAYVHYTTATPQDYVTGLGYEYEVYKVGETEPTTVYYGQNALGDSSHPESIFTITVNENGVIQSISNRVIAMIDNASPNYDNGTEEYARGVVNGNVGQTLKTTNETFWVNNAQWIEVTVDAADKLVSVAPTTVNDVADGDSVFVVYDTVTTSGQTDRNAQYVYVFETVGSGAGTSDVTYQVSGTPTIAGTKTGITLTGLTFTYEDSTATVNPGAGGTISVQLYKFAGNGYTWYKAESATMPGSTITGGTWTLNKTIVTALDAGQYYGNVTVTMADGTTQTFNQVTFTVA